LYKLAQGENNNATVPNQLFVAQGLDRTQAARFFAGYRPKITPTTPEN